MSTLVEQPMGNPPEEDIELAMEEEEEEDDDSSNDLKKKHGFVSSKTIPEPSMVLEQLETDPPMRETAISLGRFGTMRFNHVTSLIGMGILWGVAAWCMADPQGALDRLISWRGKSALYFTWFYVGTRPLFFFFVVFVGLRYGDIRLGAQDSKPEFDNMSYFTMLFAAGIAVGLFFYGVSEPLWHLTSHWYGNAGYHTQDEIAQFAMNQTLYHWGLAAWAGYVVVALACGLAAYRFKLPMTLRSSLYAIWGKYTWGWMGDVVDGFTIVVTVAGVCTSLGLGAMQIMAGLQRVGWVADDITTEQRESGLIAVIWVVTLIATISVVSGLEVGIKLLSNVAFYLGQILLFWTFALDQSGYLLNLIVQSSGYYLQYSVLLISFWTDAFGQLRPGEGRAVEVDGVDTAAAVWWMDAWTVFYMAWWTAWSGFVGIFVARISKGRTVLEVCLYGTIIPFAYILIWFCVFGGVGLRQHRQALELQALGETYYDSPGKFLRTGSSYCYDVPQEDVIFNETVIFTNNLIGVTPVCTFNSTDPDNAWFNVLNSFSFPNDYRNGFGTFFSIVSIVAVALYFVTSSDSGSLIVDHLASNGREEHHWLQRVFWAFTEGAVASALLVAGGSQSLQALQAASILAGLPYTVIICYQLQSIYIMCEAAKADPESRFLDLGDRHEFKTPVYGGIFNALEWIFSFGRVHERRVELGLDKPESHHVMGFFRALLLPMLPLYRILAKEDPTRRVANLSKTAVFTFFFCGWIGLFISTVDSYSLIVFAWTCYLINGMMLTSVKTTFRNKHGLHGNILGDFIGAMFLYPQIFVQIEEEQGRIKASKEGGDDEIEHAEEEEENVRASVVQFGDEKERVIPAAAAVIDDASETSA